MNRNTAIGIALAVVALLFAPLGALYAAEVTLRMKGGAFEIKGDLKAFDGNNYIIKSPELGLMEMDSSRYECVGSGCPSSRESGIVPQTSGAAIAPFLASENLGDATLIGGSAIGTQFIPELITSFAAANGMTVEKSVGQDNRDLTFTLTAANGSDAGRIVIRRRGETDGFKALLAGEADVVWSSRQITDAEAAEFAQQGFDLRTPGNEHVFALDALVVLVHPDNPLLTLSIDTIARIFAGEITDWAQLGNPPGKINVYAPIEGMGTWTTFEETVLKPRGLTLASDAKRLPTAVEWSDAVAADPNGIGVNTIAYIRSAKALNMEQSCGLISKPTIFSAKTEEYPMVRRLYFYTKGEPRSRLARKILAYGLSAKAQDALKNAQFVDQAPELLAFRQQGGRIAYALNAQDQDFNLDAMRELLSDISPASRLSSTFRFAVGSAFLDSKAQADVRRLARELKKDDYDQRSVILIGFADAAGKFEVNLQVSLARVTTVATALKDAGYSGPITKAYGELAPVACNDTAAGRNLNRRVEVWIK